MAYLYNAETNRLNKILEGNREVVKGEGERPRTEKEYREKSVAVMGKL